MEEIRALQLLDRELDAAAGETRERFAKPVMARLGPYMDLVFPEAQLILGDGFAMQRLERGRAGEEIERLSHGTREQLAVLVRLGFGRLLAETGTPAPLILDDALVTRMITASTAVRGPETCSAQPPGAGLDLP
jgi:hypothetical protein